jgi:cytoskeletal protein CcmA (bactofilin family)
VNGLILGEVQDVDGGETVQNVDVGSIRLYVHDDDQPRAKRARRLDASLSSETINEDLVVNGSVSDVVLAEGVFVQVNGSVSGEVIVSPTAELRIHGSVSARVQNSGRVDIFGSSSGTIEDVDGGTSEIHQPDLLIPSG